jgi:hypothetical protein
MTKIEMKESCLPALLQLRALVGFLGERARSGWWQTGFYDPNSAKALMFAFPNTAGLASYHGVREAARRFHDQNLSVGDYHLFRLPEEIEQDLHGLMQSAKGAEIGKPPSDRDTALARLREIANGSVIEGEGPKSVGSIDTLDAPATLQAIAGAYVAAFDKGAATYPYLMAKKS